MVVETKDKYNALSLLYPSHILLIDQSYIQDTSGEQLLDITTLLHEVYSVATEVLTTLPQV